MSFKKSLLTFVVSFTCIGQSAFAHQVLCPPAELIAYHHNALNTAHTYEGTKGISFYVTSNPSVFYYDSHIWMIQVELIKASSSKEAISKAREDAILIDYPIYKHARLEYGHTYVCYYSPYPCRMVSARTTN